MSSLFRTTLTIYRLIAPTVPSGGVVSTSKSMTLALQKNFSTRNVFNSSAAAALLSGPSFDHYQVTKSKGRSSYSTNKNLTGLLFTADNHQTKSPIRSVCNPSNDKLPNQQHVRKFSSFKSSKQLLPSSKLIHHNGMSTSTKFRRYISSKQITKNLTLYTNEPFKSEVDQKTLELKSPTGNPLVLMMAWLMASQKHLKKYAQIYTELGFDVAVVHITPWQLLWPAKGTQIVAAETLKFLENNISYSPIVVHGFSVGGYQFGEIMLHVEKDLKRYQQVLNRMVSQIWDSAADITEMPIGISKSIFPKNLRMQNALRNYTLYHLKTFHNQATIHYIRSSQMFHSTLLKVPALFFVSKNDLLGPVSSNIAVKDDWERANIKVTFKCWEKSGHISHFIMHKEEYLALLYKHLEETGVMESVVAVKSRAKL